MVREAKILNHTSLFDKIFSNAENVYRENFSRAIRDAPSEIQKKKARPKIEVGTKLLYGGTIYTVEQKLGRRGYSVSPGFCRMRVTQAAKAEIVP